MRSLESNLCLQVGLAAGESFHVNFSYSLLNVNIDITYQKILSLFVFLLRFPVWCHFSYIFFLANAL
jgi:hypothetical protein